MSPIRRSTSRLCNTFTVSPLASTLSATCCSPSEFARRNSQQIGIWKAPLLRSSSAGSFAQTRAHKSRLCRQRNCAALRSFSRLCSPVQPLRWENPRAFNTRFVRHKSGQVSANIKEAAFNIARQIVSNTLTSFRPTQLVFGLSRAGRARKRGFKSSACSPRQNTTEQRIEQRPRTHLGRISRLAVASKRSIRATVLRAELTTGEALTQRERK